MITVMLLGAGIGTGLWLLAVWLAPPRPALGTALHPPATPPSSVLDLDDRTWVRCVRPLASAQRASGLPTAAMVRDLEVTDTRVDDFLVQKAVLGLAGLVLPVLGAAGLAALGAGTGSQTPIALALSCAAAGFLLPDLRTRRRATRRRADFRHALSAFLDLVVISLAGGAGVDSALTGSSTIGRGWAFDTIRRALTTARLTRTTPWSTLRQLGTDLDITELTELAASVSLAGTEGARIRHSLTAKAAALRARQLTDAERRAGADTERMSLPVMALFLGFLLFIGYPAVSQVLTGL